MQNDPSYWISDFQITHGQWKIWRRKKATCHNFLTLERRYNLAKAIQSTKNRELIRPQVTSSSHFRQGYVWQGLWFLIYRTSCIWIFLEDGWRWHSICHQHNVICLAMLRILDSSCHLHWPLNFPLKSCHLITRCCLQYFWNITILFIMPTFCSRISYEFSVFKLLAMTSRECVICVEVRARWKAEKPQPCKLHCPSIMQRDNT